MDQPLNAEEKIAIEVLAHGGTDNEAAEAARVHRVAVNRWKHRPYFMAALNRRITALVEDLHAQEIALYQASLDAIRRTIEQGDVKLAARMIQLLHAAAHHAPKAITASQVTNEFRLKLVDIIPSPTPEEAKYIRALLEWQGEDVPGGLDLGRVIPEDDSGDVREERPDENEEERPS